jgi:hypothetical protein
MRIAPEKILHIRNFAIAETQGDLEKTYLKQDINYQGDDRDNNNSK